MEISPGDTFGRYQIQRFIGRGGISSVYLASDPELHRAVAAKLTDPRVFRNDPDSPLFIIRLESSPRFSTLQS